MAISDCPNCEKAVDIDGYVEHHPALFYCSCGAVLDMIKFGTLVQVPKLEVNLAGLDGQVPISRPYDWLSGGIFIKKSRWNPRKKFVKGESEL